MTPTIYITLNNPTRSRYLKQLCFSDTERGREIMQKVCDFFLMDIEDVRGLSRKRELVVARQLCMYFMKHQTKLSLKSIGAAFSGRDHSTVIYALQTIEDLMSTDKKFTRTVNEVERYLLGLISEKAVDFVGTVGEANI